MEQRIIDPNEVALKNYDLLQRIVVEGMSFSYHHDSDVMTITIGSPTEAMTEPLVDNIFYRADPDTLKIVGLEIIEFQRDFLPNNRALQECFQALYKGAISEKELFFKDPRKVPGIRRLLALAGAIGV